MLDKYRLGCEWDRETDACRVIIETLRTDPSAENVATARVAIRTFDDYGWAMFSRSLMLAVEDAEGAGAHRN